MKLNSILKKENIGKVFQNKALVFEVIEKEGELIPYSIQFGEDIRKIFNYEFICKIDYTKVLDDILGI